MKQSPNHQNRASPSLPDGEIEPLSAPALLSVWAHGRQLHPLDQALAVLSAGNRGAPDEDLAGLSLGERNRRLVTLRERTFGSRLTALADCPECGERLEFDLSTADLHDDRADDPAPREIELDGRAVPFRLVTSRDLAAAARCGDPLAARDLLARRCLSTDSGPGDLPEALVDDLAARLARGDPWAETVLDLTCPACGHAWAAAFDIASFFWSEISAEGRRLLTEVDALARTYGWREDDILALSRARRQLYLEMVS